MRFSLTVGGAMLKGTGAGRTIEKMGDIKWKLNKLAKIKYVHGGSFK